MTADPAAADPLRQWVLDACAELELDPALIDRDLVLDLARDAAHGVARPAAPLTTFLLGFAAGRDGADADAIIRANSALLALLAERSERDEPA